AVSMSWFYLAFKTKSGVIRGSVSVRVNKRREGSPWIMTSSLLRIWLSWSASCVTIAKAMFLCAANGPHTGRHDLNVLEDALHPILPDFFGIESRRTCSKLAVDLQRHIAHAEHGTARLQRLNALNFREGEITFTRYIIGIAQRRLPGGVVLDIEHLSELVLLPKPVFHGKRYCVVAQHNHRRHVVVRRTRAVVGEIVYP